MVSASTRRLPSTTIELAVRTACARAGAPSAADKARIPPRSKPATTSPRFTRTHMSMRKAPLTPRGRPQWRVSAPRFSLRAIEFRLLVSPFLLPPRRPSPPPSCCAQFRGLGSRQMNDVIESCKYHQHDDDREPDAKTDLLGTFRKRPAAYGLDCVEQKVTAIQERDRKQVEEADRDREHRGQMHERRKPDGRDLP